MTLSSRVVLVKSVPPAPPSGNEFVGVDFVAIGSEKRETFEPDAYIQPSATFLTVFLKQTYRVSFRSIYKLNIEAFSSAGTLQWIVLDIDKIPAIDRSSAE